MPKYNRICPICGGKYYCCKSCISINSWKNVCCSLECYKEFLNISNSNKKSIVLEGENDNMNIILRAGLSGGKTIDITGYDLSLGKFDCTDNTTKEFDDFEYFIVPKDEFKNISETLNKLNHKSVKNMNEKQNIQDIETS